MKKKLIAVALLVIGIAILSAGTIAYFTSQTVAHNVLTSGGVTIELQEWADEECTVPYPDEPIAAMPGQTVTKVAKVKNTDADAFIRAQFTITVLQNGDPIQLDNLAQAIVIVPGEGWTKGTDGWYYYNEPLGKDEVTEALFSQVQFDGPGMGNEYQDCTIQVDVFAQAVQKANNGESAIEAQGWPEPEAAELPTA